MHSQLRVHSFLWMFVRKVSVSNPLFFIKRRLGLESYWVPSLQRRNMIGWVSKVAWLGLLSLRVYKRFVFLVTLQGFVHSRDCTHSVLVDGLGGLVHSTKVWINQPAHTLLRFLKSNLRSSSTSVATARNRSNLHSVKTQPLLHQFTVWTSDWICEFISCGSMRQMNHKMWIYHEFICLMLWKQSVMNFFSIITIHKHKILHIMKPASALS